MGALRKASLGCRNGKSLVFFFYILKASPSESIHLKLECLHKYTIADNHHYFRHYSFHITLNLVIIFINLVIIDDKSLIFIKLSGILSLSTLFETSSHPRLSISPMLPGMLLVIQFLETSSLSRFCYSATDAGIAPVIMFPDRSSYFKFSPWQNLSTTLVILWSKRSITSTNLLILQKKRGKVP